MIDFKITHLSKKSKARIGILKTPHGQIETPAFVGVATQAVVKTLTEKEVEDTKTQILISNTFHLHIKPGEEYLKKAGGIHKFMNWNAPLMTDSGGFQVFSLGFGRDHGVGKILKEKTNLKIKAGKKPKNVTITEDGVFFSKPQRRTEAFHWSKRIYQNSGSNWSRYYVCI